MSEIVILNSRKQRDLDVWQCQCGNYEFWLYSDGSVSCANCERDAHSTQGDWTVPTRVAT
jgi:hypothetical protein